MLTDKAIRALRPRTRPYKTFDDRGLYLLTQPNGSRLWRFKYRFAGREKLEAIGSYPGTSLAEACTDPPFSAQVRPLKHTP